MSYQLGIDFGTTSVAAAVRRPGHARAEVVTLGNATTAPSALHLARDGSVTVGEGALRLAGIDPGRVVRGLARKVGDPTPILLGRESWTAEALSARLVRWVVDRVADRECGPAARIVLAHPAAWTAHTQESLAVALDGHGLSVAFVAEPRAAAVAHAVLAGGAADDPVAVYDLGGGRFDAAVLRRDPAVGPEPGFRLAGPPEGIADVGGLAFDDLLWEHVRAALPEGIVLDARARRVCLRAKETLSAKSEVVVRIRQEELRGDVRLDRATFEGLIAPHVGRTVAALRSAVASAGLAPGDLGAVLLVGGASRIPLVARTVSAELGRPVTLLDDPELLVARGAALVPDAVAPGVVAAQPSSGTAAPEPVADVPAPDVAVSQPADGPAPVVAESQPADGPVPVVAESPEAATVPALVASQVVAPRPVVDDPGAAAAAPGPDPDPPTVPVPAPAAPVPAPAAPVPAPAAPVPAPVAAVPAPAHSPSPVRVPAVLDAGSRRGGPRHSLPRLLLGTGAVVVAVLVLVALFRPDGPLDPPLDPVGKDAAQRATSAPALHAPRATVPAPVPVLTPSVPVPGNGIDAGDAAAAVRLPEPVRAPAGRPAADQPAADLPADAVRSPVDTTPAAPPHARTTGPRAAAGGGNRTDGVPVGAAPRTPPTPAAPLA